MTTDRTDGGLDDRLRATADRLGIDLDAAVSPRERMARGYATPDGTGHLRRVANAYRPGDETEADRVAAAIDRAEAAGRRLSPVSRLAVGYRRSAADAHRQLEQEQGDQA